MKKLKLLVTTLLATTLLMSSITVSAAELDAPKYSSNRIVSETPITVDGKEMVEVEHMTESGTDSVLLPRSIYGYAADYTDYDAGSFTVNAPGSATSTGHATIKSSDFSSSSVLIYVTIYRPDGTRAVTNAKLTGNQEKVVSFTNAQPGNYKVVYSVDGTVKGWIHCWIY